MTVKWDSQGHKWIGSDYHLPGHEPDYVWMPEDADTDMSNLYGDELERFCGPLFDSYEEWNAAAKDSVPLLKRWYLQDRRARPDLGWSW